MHNIAVVHHVGLAFEPIDAVVLRFLHRAVLLEVLVGDDFRAYEAMFEVGVDLGSTLRRGRAFGNGPGPALVLADGEEDDLVHAVEDAAQGLVLREVGQVQVLHERLAILFGQLG